MPPTFTAWMGALSNGPVILNHTDDADIAADCSLGTNAFTLTLFAYAGPNSLFPTNKNSLQGFSHFTSTGAKIDIAVNYLKPSNYTVSSNGQLMSAKFTLCSTNPGNTLDAAFAFTNGNAYCVTLTR